jgi:ABC-type nitrate/sulfonate/bicarbonate transport system substrate-binding protein
VHLPFYAAVADGLFAEHGLDVELLESAPGSQRVKLLAGGGGDFLLTATLYHLQAVVEEGPLAVGACAVVHRRNPVAAIVPVDSPCLVPADLAGWRMGAPVGTQMGWLAVELQASLARLGIAPAAVVDMSYKEAYGALARGEIDLIANFADLLPIDQQRAGVPLRAVAVGPDVYTSSLLAADRVPDDIVERMTAAMAATFDRQRADPTRGVSELRAMYPDVDPVVAVDTWSGLESYAFPSPRGSAGVTDRAGWERAIAWAVQTHGLPEVGVDDVVRPLTPAPVS